MKTRSRSHIIRSRWFVAPLRVALSCTLLAVAVVTGIGVSASMASGSNTASISGTVMNAQGGTLSGVEVLVFGTMGSQEPGDSGEMTTADDGRYKIGGLIADSYKIQFDPLSSFYAVQLYNGTLGGSAFISGAKTVPVADGASVDAINATLAIGGTIYGKVTNTSGKPVPGICVIATNGAQFSDPAFTDSNGEYAILGLAAAHYVVRFFVSWPQSCGGAWRPVQYATQFFNGHSGTPSQLNALELRVRPGAILTVDAAMVLAKKEKQLRVLSTSGKIGEALLMKTKGGSGTGIVDYTVANGTANNCQIHDVNPHLAPNRSTLTATSKGTCKVYAYKAPDGVYQGARSKTIMVTFS